MIFPGTAYGYFNFGRPKQISVEEKKKSTAFFQSYFLSPFQFEISTLFSLHFSFFFFLPLFSRQGALFPLPPTITPVGITSFFQNLSMLHVSQPQ